MPDAGREKTDEELAALEKRIASVYQEAAADMEETIKSYFASFSARDLEQKARLEAGEITEAEYTQWRLTQIGRGQRYEAMRDALAERYTNANEAAMAYVNDDMASIYALNRTYTIDAAVADAGGIIEDVNFIRYDEATVKRLIKDNPDLMPHYPETRAVQRGIDLAYGKQQITASVTSGILQGNSVGKIANDLMTRVTDMSSTSAVRAARTAITNAENAGRQDGAEELASKGCIMQKAWIATHDGRTRPEHLEADGQTVPLDEPFDVGGEDMMYPGDSNGSGWNVYNCRCSRKDTIVGFKSILEE